MSKRILILALCVPCLFALPLYPADAHPPVGAVVTAKDNGKAYKHLGGGKFEEVAVPSAMPAAKSGCGCDVCTCPSALYPTNCGDARCPVNATGNDALAAVNAKRAARGLPPYQFDAGLTAAAEACATYRAQRLMFGHTANDFAFAPPGVRADATGCAAYPASYGFMACAVYDSYRYAGAAMVPGADGKVYCHLFVSNTPNGAPSLGYLPPNPAALPQGVYAPPSGAYYLPGYPQSCPNGNCKLK